MPTDPKVEMLRRVPLFSSCRPGELDRIAALADEVDVPAGRTLIREGATGQEFFIVLDGEIEVERDGTRLATLGPGDFLGEIALIDDRPRSATATTTRPSRLLVVGHREFHSLLDSHAQVQIQVLKALADRVRRSEPDTV